MNIPNFAKNIIEKVIVEVNKKDNKEKIERKIIDPLIYYTFKRLYPYIVLSASIFLLTFIFCILILVLLIKELRSRN
tara:strand:+ start:329 stop:559 length:231 start_codon:yes stop_codon:yes gene_type:complete